MPNAQSKEDVDQGIMDGHTTQNKTAAWASTITSLARDG